MADIRYENGTFEVDAEIIGKGLGLEPERVLTMMQEGEITSRTEVGQGEDDGRYRLTFFYGRERFYLVVDENGHVLHTSPEDS